MRNNFTGIVRVLIISLLTFLIFPAWSDDESGISEPTYTETPSTDIPDATTTTGETGASVTTLDASHGVSTYDPDTNTQETTFDTAEPEE